MESGTDASPQTPLPRDPYGLGKRVDAGVGSLARGFQRATRRVAATRWGWFAGVGRARARPYLVTDFPNLDNL